MSAAESWDQLAVNRPAVIRPSPPVDVVAPAQDLAAPTPEQVQATEAVFSNKESADAEAVIGLWMAGMLANQLIRDAAENLAADDDANKQPSVSPPTPPQ
jgi:hypothetical protein